MTAYTPTGELLSRIQRDFTYHRPDKGQAERMQLIRDACGQLATVLLHLTPPSREQSLALTALEQVSMWANASIARNESPAFSTGADQ